MKKLTLFLALAMVLVLAACGQSKEEGSKESKTADTETVKIKNTYQITGEKQDGSDAKDVSEEVEVPKNPKTIAVMDYGTLSTIKEMGKADNVKGVSKGENEASLPSFLKEFKGDQTVNLGSLKEPNFEKLAGLKPDVIFISGRQASDKVLSEMKKAAPKAAIVYTGTSNDKYIDTVKENTEKLGKIFDEEKKAEELNKQLDNKIKEVQDLTAKSDAKGLFILANEGELSVFGKGGRFGFIHDVLGVKAADENIKAEGHGQVINYEYLNKTNPDIIFAMDRGVAVSGKSSAQKSLSNDVVKDVNAIKEDKVIELDPYLWYFSAGGVKTTIDQISEVEKAYK